MFSNLRLSMTWLHTWLGLVFGFLLIVIFFFGTLSVFDREIDRWALPETRFEPQIIPSYEAILADVFANTTPEKDELAAARLRVDSELQEPLQPIIWGAYTTHRDPTLHLYKEFAIPNNPDDPFDHIHGYTTIDPRTGKIFPKGNLEIGSAFFYPLHYSLNISWKSIGYFIVGAAALIMLVALVSGVIIHRKIFREFFTFRPKKQFQRKTLDLHNMTGVVALPFHFFFALTGLIIFASIYFPVYNTVLQKPAFAHAQEQAEQKGLPFFPAGITAPMASVDAMVSESKKIWVDRGTPGEVGHLIVQHPGDKNSYVSIYRAGTDTVSLVGEGIHFEAISGNILYQEPPLTTVSGINEFLTGLHLQHFEHWFLRWLYVFGGLAGCICIATGFVFYVEKRKRQIDDSASVRWIDAFAITTITGMLIATLAMLVANRLLPETLINKGTWEIRIFCLVWIAALAHAFLRCNKLTMQKISPAWSEQSLIIAVLSLSAVLLNWITTGDHLVKTITTNYWPVAAIDLVLLIVSILAIYIKGKLRVQDRQQTFSQILSSSSAASSTRSKTGDISDA